MTNLWVRDAEYEAKADVIKEHVRFMATTQMNISSDTWNTISNDILTSTDIIVSLIEENSRLRYLISNISSIANSASLERENT